MDFKENEVKRWEYWYSKLHLWMPDRVDDGTFVQAGSERLPEKWGLSFAEIRTFAVPLRSLTDAEMVHGRLVKPLVSDVEARSNLKGDPQDRRGNGE